ncbi:MAG: pyridoxal 5'-phosphate synthase glutaminase subunit PdxT [Oligoflexales bacterium]
MSTIIGVLALQGAYALHKPHIEACGATYLEIRSEEDLKQCNGLILPGGESSTMLKLIEHKKMWKPLDTFLSQKPSWGICAGAILLANKILSHKQKSFQKIPIEVCRNGYGRQIASHEDTIDEYQVSWIRAPRIETHNSDVTVYHKNTYGDAVWAEFGLTTVTTFHPELNLQTPSPWHQRLFEKIEQIKSGKTVLEG